KGQGNRVFLVIVYTDGSRKSMSNARYIVEQALGRELTDDETVDHIDEDYENDNVSNLGLSTGGDNNRYGKISCMYKFICPADGCGVPAEKPYSQVKKNWSRADNGPFCSRECSGVMSHKDPIGRTPGEVFERILLEHPPSVVETHGVDPNFVPHYPRAE